ncbi:MAG: PAS domain-containing protein [Pseudomonadota bacterium]
MTFFSDITERKMMIDSLHRSEERYRLVIENVGEGMIVLQGEHIVFANARASEIARISHDDFFVGWIFAPRTLGRPRHRPGAQAFGRRSCCQPLPDPTVATGW